MASFFLFVGDDQKGREEKKVKKEETWIRLVGVVKIFRGDQTL